MVSNTPYLNVLGPIDSLRPSNTHAPDTGPATPPRAMAAMYVLNTTCAHHRVSMPHETLLT